MYHLDKNTSTINNCCHKNSPELQCHRCLSRANNKQTLPKKDDRRHLVWWPPAFISSTATPTPTPDDLSTPHSPRDGGRLLNSSLSVARETANYHLWENKISLRAVFFSRHVFLSVRVLLLSRGNNKIMSEKERNHQQNVQHSAYATESITHSSFRWKLTKSLGPNILVQNMEFTMRHNARLSNTFRTYTNLEIIIIYSWPRLAPAKLSPLQIAYSSLTPASGFEYAHRATLSSDLIKTPLRCVLHFIYLAFG